MLNVKTISLNSIFFSNVDPSLQKLGYCEPLVLRRNTSWTNITIVKEDIVFWHPYRLWTTTNPAVFWTSPTTRLGVMRVAVLAVTGSCLCMRASVCLPAFLSAWDACVFVLRPSLALSPYKPLRSASKKKRKQQSAVVDSNGASKQHYKCSLQTSYSQQLWSGLSHLHLTQVRKETTRQPLTILAVEVTVILWPPIWKQFLCLAHSFAMRPSKYSLLLMLCFPTKEKCTDRAHSFNQIILSSHHKYTTLKSLPFQTTVVSIFTAFTAV